MLSYLKKIQLLLGSEIKKIPFIIFLFFLISILDIAGLSLIIPYVSIILGDYQILNSYIDINSYFSKNEIIVLVGVVLLFLLSVKALMVFYGNYSIMKFTNNIRKMTALKLLKSYQNLKFIEYSKRNSSEYINGIQKLSDSFAQFILYSILKIFCEGMIITFILIFLAIYNLPILIILSFIFFICFIMYNNITSNMGAYGEKSNSALKDIISVTSESLNGLREVRLYKKEGFFYNLVNSSATTYANNLTKLQIISIMPRYLFEIIILVIFLAIVFYGVLIYENIILIIPTLTLLGFASLRIIPSINVLAQSYVQLKFHQNTLDLISNDIKNYQNLSTQNKFLIKEDDPDFQTLVIKNLNFKYISNSDLILSNVNLTIKKCESIGIMGESGSGKTTLINIILGLLTPDKDSVFLNDNNSINDNINNWQSKIAYIPQEPFLLDRSLISNIALDENRDKIDIARVETLIEQCKLKNVYDELSLKSNSSIGERGMRLSGGQKQRVAIARALYFNREILVMDEPTSNLDKKTESELIKYIYTLKDKVTIILISHNNDALKYCDKVFKLENKELIET